MAASGQNSGETLHLVTEALKLSVADRIAYAGRPDIPIGDLLSKEYAAHRRELIDRDRAHLSEGERFGGLTGPDIIGAGTPGDFSRECTTHFDVVDGEGSAVSVTQSLGAFFGSGAMAGDTGIMLNNFLFWAELDPASAAAVVAPHKRMGTRMAPVAISRDGRLFVMIGTPGSYGIPQTTQMISNVLDHGFSIQAAIEAPRIRTYSGTTIDIEGRVPEDVRAELTRRGHDLRVIPDWSPAVGGGQGIMIDPESGVLMGARTPGETGMPSPSDTDSCGTLPESQAGKRALPPERRRTVHQESV